ncbi:HIT domain-containing protein [Acetomicrobium sp. S15 = DSM 107314]|jgi:histidine triad (HIT) family protein|uniref:HIT domain-containing protein n=1 Tax=Acetomicrobium sp. S15 = DSM 107314 TaxID=2529858 RepID=UPI0018E18142|nr:HIT domain-containing protein [Acetomicrobium sp. S15 = DSM 107314]
MVQPECPFCSIARGEQKADVVLETEDVVVIRDIAPQAPVHLLAIPKVHIPSAAFAKDGSLWASLMTTAVEVAAAQGLSSYRLVVNCGEQAGMSIPHLHVHILGGRRFRWPPG